jgi:hypothetical protein
MKKSERFAAAVRQSVAGKCEKHGITDNCINNVIVEDVDETKDGNKDGMRDSLIKENLFVDKKNVTLT